MARAWLGAVLLAATLTPVDAQMGGGGFGGPSVMGRGRQSGTRGGQAVRLRGFASVNGVYDSGLTTINENGVVGQSGATGVEARWGGYGTRNERRSAFGLDYQGDYRQYNTARGFNGLSQMLTMTYSNQPARHISFDVSAMAGTTNRAFGMGTGTADLGTGVSAVTIPTTSFFDVRTNFLGASGAATLIFTNRLSLSLQGSGYTVRRKNGLPGVNGAIGRMDLAYRLSRRQTVGADVMYYKFDYRNAFGDVNVIDPGLLYSLQVGRNWEFTARVGVMRVESFGERQVTFSPEIAQLLGVGSTSEIFYLRTFQPSGALRLMRTFRRGSITGGYRISPNPGNGLLFASRMNHADVVATWNATKRLNFSAGGSYARMASVTSLAGSYEQYMGGGGVNFKMTRTLELQGRIDRRVATLNTGAGTAINGTRIVAGIVFSPADIPLQLW